MARPRNKSLDYYPRDTKDDINLQYVESIHGFEGYAIVHKLWQHIYGGENGYYAIFTKVHRATWASKNGISLEKLESIISTCMEDGIDVFSGKMYEQFQILTSYGVQKRWLGVVVLSKRKDTSIDINYRLLPEETVINSGNIQEEMPQSKVKESKVKESKVKESKGEGDINPPAEIDFKNQKQESEEELPAAKFLAPGIDEVKNYFFSSTKNYWDGSRASLSASKFFNHYKSLGWKTSTGVPVDDWKALADKWIIDDLATDRKQKQNVPRDTSKASNGVYVDPKKEKVIVNTLYTEYANGAIRPEYMPPNTYSRLVDDGLLSLTNEQKTNLLTQCNGDETMAKRMAVVKFFDQLIVSGKSVVYDLKIA